MQMTRCHALIAGAAAAAVLAAAPWLPTRAAQPI